MSAGKNQIAKIVNDDSILTAYQRGDELLLVSEGPQSLGAAQLTRAQVQALRDAIDVFLASGSEPARNTA